MPTGPSLYIVPGIGVIGESGDSGVTLTGSRQRLSDELPPPFDYSVIIQADMDNADVVYIQDSYADIDIYPLYPEEEHVINIPANRIYIRGLADDIVWWMVVKRDR